MRAVVLAVVLAACGHPAPATPPAGDAWARSGIDWSAPPAVPAPGHLVLPAITELALGNGVRVVIVENHRLPIVAVTVLELAAGAREDGAHPGLAALVADLLDEGAGTRDRDALADELDRLGARLDLDIATDAMAAHAVTTGDTFEATLLVLADVIRRPRFADADVARIRDERVAELAQRRDQPRTVAAQVFDRIAFGAHPYAHPAEGQPDAVAALTAADVRAFHARAYGPATTTIVIAGDVVPARARGALERAFGDWHSGPSAAAAAPALPAFQPVLAAVDVPGAETAAVMIGRRAPATVDPAAEVANAVLGGSQTARLDRKLRGELGAATGAGSSFWSGAWAGTWGVATNLHTPRAAEAIRAALAEIDAARTTDLAGAEIAQARGTLGYAIARSFETTTGTVHALERAIVHGQPVASIAARSDELAQVTPASARAAAAALWQGLAIVVVGDWSVIGPELRMLGLPVVRFDRDGRVLP